MLQLLITRKKQIEATKAAIESVGCQYISSDVQVHKHYKIDNLDSTFLQRGVISFFFLCVSPSLLSLR